MNERVSTSKKMHPEDYIAAERQGSARQEYFNGQVIPKSGGNRWHNLIATSVAIGIVGFANNQRYNVIPVILGIGGACFLFYGSMLLIFEARLALSTIHHEMDFIWKRSKKVAPAEVVEHYKPHFVHFRRHE